MSVDPAIPSWFDPPERRAALRAEALRWEGTPFFANSEACGRDGGADCGRLVHGVLCALGAIPPLALPRVPMDAGQHAVRSVLIEALETLEPLRRRFQRLPDCSPANLAAGDVLCFTAGRVPHHAGLMLTGAEFLHTLPSVGAHRLHVRSVVLGWKIFGQLAAVYRPRP